MADEADELQDRVSVISVLGESVRTAHLIAFTTPAASGLHKAVRDKDVEGMSLSEIIASTEEPTELPTWQRTKIEAEEVG